MEKLKTFKYSSDNAKLIHNFLERVLNEIKPSHFSEKDERNHKDLIRKFRDYDNFKYLANRWLWETFFRYEESQIKWMFMLAKTLKEEFGASSEEATIQLFIRSMSLAPPEKKKQETKERTSVQKESKPLTLDDLSIPKEEEEEEEEDTEDEDDSEKDEE